MKKGFVYLIGAGPGDPDLFTIKGQKVLAKSDVVIYDRLVAPELLSYAIKAREFIYVGKEAGQHTLSQDKINQLLVKKAGEGKIVARLKGGDPFVFGRGGEEALYIRQQGFDYELIPGITSAIAVPAYAGIPVTHRQSASSFSVITGHEKEDKLASTMEWEKLSNGADTLVFLMGNENLENIVTRLQLAGKDPETPVALIRNGTLPDQQVITGTLRDISQQARSAGLKPPVVIIVGENVKLREELQWLENKPLWGKTILITRARAQASLMVEKIRELGGRALEFPTIKIVKEKDLHGLYSALKSIENYDWIVFTSVNGVDIFFKEIAQQGLDIRALRGPKICAIGPVTAESLASRGLTVDVIPDEFRAEGVVKELSTCIQPGQRVLLPRAKGAREILPASLALQGVVVDEIILYEAVPEGDFGVNVLEQIKEGQIHFITFTSSSTVANFVKLLGSENAEIDQRVKIACIGPVTAQTALDHGFRVDLIPNKYTIDALIAAIVEEVQGSQNDREIAAKG